MDLPKPLRFALVNRGIAIGALAVGAALVVVGFVAGFGSALSTLLSDPLNPGDALESANPAITIAFSLLGYLVWQFASAYALFATLPRAAGEEAAERFDTERVKSEILEVLDRRLSEMHDDIEETHRDVAEIRRSVQELKREEHATSFEEGEVPSTESIESSAEGVATRPGDPSRDDPPVGRPQDDSPGADDPFSP